MGVGGSHLCSWAPAYPLAHLGCPQVCGTVPGPCPEPYGYLNRDTKRRPGYKRERELAHQLDSPQLQALAVNTLWETYLFSSQEVSLTGEGRSCFSN